MTKTGTTEPSVPFVPGLHDGETFSGGYVNLGTPDPAQIQLMDIAHGLGNTCRYNGQCRRFYSVAEHAVLVSRKLRDQGYPLSIVLAGLHHDDGEAISGDITRPMKKLLAGVVEPIEERIRDAVMEALGLEGLPFDHPAVKSADDWALMREAYELMPSRGKYWAPWTSHVPGPAPWRVGWSPKRASRRWLKEHKRLINRTQGAR